MANRTLEEAETELARLRSRASYGERRADYWYEKNRLLENAVRTAATQSDTFVDRSAALANLLRRVPKVPRKKLRTNRRSLRGRH